MGLYVEVMCDLRITGKDPLDPLGLRALCWSDRNDNPQGGTVREAKREARKQGWKFGHALGNGFFADVCPGCKNNA